MNLKEFITTPDVQTFRYRADEIAGVELMDDGGGDESILELKVQYASPREYRDMLTDGMQLDRKAVSKKGIKAITINEDKARRIICRRLIKDWKLTVAGAYALELTADLAGQDPTSEIDFNNENLGVMIDHSQIAAVVNELMTNHSRWFKSPEDDDDDAADPISEDSSKNSSGGPNSSSGKPPAETVSKVTSTSIQPTQAS